MENNTEILKNFDEVIKAGEKFVCSIESMKKNFEVIIDATKSIRNLYSRDFEKTNTGEFSSQLPTTAKTIHTPEIAESVNEAKYSLEDLRKVLAAKANEGCRDEVRDLLKKYGAHKLSELDKQNYDAFIIEAKGLSHQ